MGRNSNAAGQGRGSNARRTQSHLCRFCARPVYGRMRLKSWAVCTVRRVYLYSQNHGEPCHGFRRLMTILQLLPSSVDVKMFSSGDTVTSGKFFFLTKPKPRIVIFIVAMFVFIPTNLNLTHRGNLVSFCPHFKDVSFFRIGQCGSSLWHLGLNDIFFFAH